MKAMSRQLDVRGCNGSQRPNEGAIGHEARGPIMTQDNPTEAVPSDGSVDIVIVNWNSGRQLQRVLASVQRHADIDTTKAFVVDNDSSDGSQRVSMASLQTILLQQDSNLGFARACNIGANAGRGRFILFLDPDAEIVDRSIQTAVAFLNEKDNASFGICGIHLYGEEGATQKHCVRFPTARSFIGQSLGLDVLFPSAFQPMFMTDFDHEESRPVDHVIGAFYLIRREVFDALGGFDERFFVYLEDLDLSLRASRAGWRTYYLAQASAFHKGGGTSEQVKARRLFYSLRSKLLYAFKHFSTLPALAVMAVTLFVEPFARTARAGLRRSRSEFGETLSAYGLLFADMPRLIPLFLRGRA